MVIAFITHIENWCYTKEALYILKQLCCLGMCTISFWSLKERIWNMYFNRVWNSVEISLVGRAPDCNVCVNSMWPDNVTCRHGTLSKLIDEVMKIIQENTSENVVWRMSSILLRHRISVLRNSTWSTYVLLPGVLFTNMFDLNPRMEK